MVKSIASSIMSPENRSMLMHIALNIIGCIPGPIGFFANAANSVMYFMEHNPNEAIKNMILSMAGSNLLQVTQKFGTMFGLSSEMAQLVAGWLTFADNTLAAMLSAKDFGDFAADMIDKYMVDGAEFSAETVLEIAMLGSYGLQTSTYANYTISMSNYLQTCLNAYDGMLIENVANQGVGVKENNGTGWYNSDGSINYPPNNGAVPGTEKEVTLETGDTIGRYGEIGEYSTFVTETGADANMLALPPNTNPEIYQEYIVIKPIPETISSTVAPWAGNLGGGIQYDLPHTLNWLLENGYLIKR